MIDIKINGPGGLFQEPFSPLVFDPPQHYCRVTSHLESSLHFIVAANTVIQGKATRSDSVIPVG